MSYHPPPPASRENPMNPARDAPPSLPGFHGGVRPRRGQQRGTGDPVGSAGRGAVGDHTQRGARGDTVCFLSCGVGQGPVRSPETRGTAEDVQTRAPQQRRGARQAAPSSFLLGSCLCWFLTLSPSVLGQCEQFSQTASGKEGCFMKKIFLLEIKFKNKKLALAAGEAEPGQEL